MTKITCDIVKDLIPLYVDDVLSSDSKMLVEEHLQSCEMCNDYYNAMNEETLHSLPTEKQEEKVIKKIKKKININRIVTAVSSTCIVALVCGVIFYGICIRESYIPYEESIIYVENGILKTDNNYNIACEYKSAGHEKDLFIYLSTTPYKKMTYSQAAKLEIFHLSNSNEDEEYCNRIYYLPEKYAKQFYNKKSSIIEENYDEIVKEAILIWQSKD